MKTCFVLCGICSSILFSAAFHSGAQEAEPAGPVKSNHAAPPPLPEGISPALAEKLKAAAANLWARVLEVVRMSDAGTDAAVIQSFVENSPTAFHPRAEEIIYLHDHGISTPIITAMIQHPGKQGGQAEA